MSSPYPPVPPAPLGPSGPPGKEGMPVALIVVLVIVGLHALGTAVGGWAVLQENYTKQEHGQDLLMPMSVAWFVALLCWGLAALQTLCVVLARKRRAWVRVVLAAGLSFMALSTIAGFLGSLSVGSPSLAVLVVFGIDVVALWVVFGETAGHWFTERAS